MGVKLTSYKKKSYKNEEPQFKTEATIHFKLDKIQKTLEYLLSLGR